MPTETQTTLGPVLDLIERWHRIAKSLVRTSFGHGQHCCVRMLQHAAQLRYSAGFFRYAGDVGPAEAFESAANFLCAPRREPEAE